MTEPFRTQPFDAAGRLDCGAYVVERVSLEVDGLEIIGNLFLPTAPPRAAIAIIGPVGYVKEQSPIQYASRLARDGLAALIFDPRFNGESAGEPRRLESGVRRVEDLRAALAYLRARPECAGVDAAILGICQGVNWAARIAADARLPVALVAGHYLTPATTDFYVGDTVAERLERSRRAHDDHAATGHVGYLPIVPPTADDLSAPALLNAQPVGEFYRPWEDRGPFWNFHGLWENRIPAMCEEAIWTHDVTPTLAELSAPVLMIHADKAASGPSIPKQLFETVGASDKRLVWLGPRNQLQFYQDPLTIDLVVTQLTGFFTANRCASRPPSRSPTS